jgi:hypothetical protein
VLLCRREQRRLPAIHCVGELGLAHDHLDAVIAIAHQLDDVVARRVFYILAVDGQNLVAGLQLRNEATKF